MSRQSCPRCTRPLAHCLCGAIPDLCSRTRVTILQHPEESRHPLNTGRLVALGLRRAELVCGEVFSEGLWQEPGAWLLFPGDGAVSVGEIMPGGQAPAHLIVPDGTWRMAGRLLRLNPGLAALPRLSIPAGEPSRYRVRNTSQAGAVATIEAVVRALEVLEAPTRFDALLAPFDLMVARQLAAMAQAHADHPGQRHRPVGTLPD
jgi:DTW domain-containing protein YfiP